jgi:hypothetical protein
MVVDIVDDDIDMSHESSTKEAQSLQHQVSNQFCNQQNEAGVNYQ